MVIWIVKIQSEGRTLRSAKEKLISSGLDNKIVEQFTKGIDSEEKWKRTIKDLMKTSL